MPYDPFAEDTEKPFDPSLSKYIEDEGQYHVQVASVDRGKSDKGNEYIKVSFVCLAGPCEGKEMSHWFWEPDPLNEGSMYMADRLLCCCGLKTPQNAKPANTYDFDDLHGMHCVVQVVMKPGKRGDKKFAKIDESTKGGGILHPSSPAVTCDVCDDPGNADDSYDSDSDFD